MWLKRALNRRVGDKEYHKWAIADVPPSLIEDLGWEHKQALEWERKGRGILIRPTTATTPKPEPKKKARGG